jgi:hypothetical protein
MEVAMRLDLEFEEWRVRQSEIHAQAEARAAALALPPSTPQDPNRGLNMEVAARLDHEYEEWRVRQNEIHAQFEARETALYAARAGRG